MTDLEKLGSQLAALESALEVAQRENAGDWHMRALGAIERGTAAVGRQYAAARRGRCHLKVIKGGNDSSFPRNMTGLSKRNRRRRATAGILAAAASVVLAIGLIGADGDSPGRRYRQPRGSSPAPTVTVAPHAPEVSADPGVTSSRGPAATNDPGAALQSQSTDEPADPVVSTSAAARPPARPSETAAGPATIQPRPQPSPRTATSPRGPSGTCERHGRRRHLARACSG